MMYFCLYLVFVKCMSTFNNSTLLSVQDYSVRPTGFELSNLTAEKNEVLVIWNSL